MITVLSPETDADHTVHTVGPADVFLAGGITGCPNWQQKAISLIEAAAPGLVVANPRRSQTIPDHGHQAMTQIAWEHRNLADAGLILFWFVEHQVQPIVLFELGKALGRGQEIVIGVHPDYPRAFDVNVQIALKRPTLPIHDSLEAVVANAIDLARPDRPAPMDTEAGRGSWTLPMIPAHRDPSAGRLPLG